MSYLSNFEDTKMEINAFDYVMFPFFVFSLLISYGVLDAIWWGYDLSYVLLDLGGGHVISVTVLVAVVTLVWVAITNDWDNSKLSAMQLWIVIATIAIVIAPPAFPVLVDTIAETPAGLLATAIASGGWISFSYAG